MNRCTAKAASATRFEKADSLILVPTGSGYSLKHPKVSVPLVQQLLNTITKRSVRLEPHKLLDLTNTWDTGINVTTDGICLRGERGSRYFFGNSNGAYDNGFEAGCFLTSLGATPIGSYSTSVYEREPNGERLGRLKRKAGWTGAVGISLVRCIRCRRPDFHRVPVRQRSGVRTSRSRLAAVSGTKYHVCVCFHLDGWAEVP